MKLLFILGTRPDAIKLSPVIKTAKAKKNIKVFTCITAQHREMLDQVIRFFNIKPDFDLDLMSKNQKLADFTSLAIKKINNVILKVKPDWVIVQGDTNTTFLGALCAYYNRIKIAHVEAGLRTYRKYAPFPEEINRVMTTHLADLHFAPTLKAKDALLKENVPRNKIVITGNTGIDALLLTLRKIKDSRIKNQKELSKINFSKKVLLITGHRRESFGKPFMNICLALKEIAKKFPELELVYPVHLNPNVKRPVRKILSNIVNIHLIEPLEYPSFIWLMKQSYIILTDSGGIQEEAPSLKKPVLVMRDVSERPEGIKLGIAKLVGTNKNRIISSMTNLLCKKNAYKKMIATYNPYGDGLASRKIIKTILLKT